MLIRVAGLDVWRAYWRRRMQARFYVPCAVRGLGSDQIFNASPPGGITGRNSASIMQRKQCPPGRVRIARAPLDRVPAAIALLCRLQFRCYPRECAVVCASPFWRPSVGMLVLQCSAARGTAPNASRALYVLPYRLFGSSGCTAGSPGLKSQLR
jgi:hypothetical protein